MGFVLGLFGCLLNYGMGIFNMKLDQNRMKPIEESLLIVIMFGFFILIFMLILAKSNSTRSYTSSRRKSQEVTHQEDADFVGVRYGILKSKIK